MSYAKDGLFNRPNDRDRVHLILRRLILLISDRTDQPDLRGWDEGVAKVRLLLSSDNEYGLFVDFE